jgi:hypothetical protein
MMAPVWKSRDGGATWRKYPQLPSPDGSLAVGDQKVVFGEDGSLYVVVLAFDRATLRCRIFRQTAGADDPLTPGTPYGFDQAQLEIDRSVRRNRLYSPWVSERGGSMVTASNDFGQTLANLLVGDNSRFENRTTRLSVGPDGRAYVIFKTQEGFVDDRFENAHFWVKRSDDGGVTWDAIGPAGVSVHGASQVRTWNTTKWGNENKGKVARARSSDAWIAVDPGDGDVYAVYVDRDASGLGQIYAARSINGGVTWTSSRVTDGTHHSAYPEVAVTAGGVAGVLYIDYDDSGPVTIFRHRFAQSSDNGLTWIHQNLQSMGTGLLSPFANGTLWGDYEGLTAHGSTFYGVFTGLSIGRTRPQLDPIFFTVRTGPQIRVPGAIDAGEACLRSKRAVTLQVCNTAKDDLTVSAIASSNPLFSVTAPSSGYPIIISHDFCFPFQVVFEAMAAGPQSAILTIRSNDPESPDTKIQASGNGVEQDIRVTGSTDFGLVGRKEAAEKTVSVCNTGGCILSVETPAVSCADFTLINSPFPAGVRPGACLDLVVSFTPTRPGPKICELKITSDDPDTSSVRRQLTARTHP